MFYSILTLVMSVICKWSEGKWTFVHSFTESFSFTNRLENKGENVYGWHLYPASVFLPDFINDGNYFSFFTLHVPMVLEITIIGGVGVI